MAFQFPANPTLGQQFAPATGTTYEWNGTGWIFLGVSTASLYPAGIVLPYAGNSMPFQGWLLCDGASYSTTAYPVLFAVIGYTYGGGGGAFNVPDLRGRVISGPDGMMGGAIAGRIGGSLTPHGASLGASGGSEVVALTLDQIPAHSHSITDVAHNHGVGDPGHAHSVSDPGHAHGITDVAHAHSVYDPSHNHGLNDPGHGHGVNDPTHAHSVADPTHSHSHNDPQHAHGYQQSNNTNGNIYAYQGGGPSGIMVNDINTGTSGINLAIYGSGTGIGIYGAYTGVTIAGSGTGQWLNAAYSGVAIYGSGTGLSATNAVGSGIGIYGAGTGIYLGASGTGIYGTNNAGGNNWHWNMQPTLTLNFIIKA